MAAEFIRNITFFKSYYIDFYNAQRIEVKNKLNWTLQLISIQDRIPEKYFKHISGSEGIFEIRVEVGSDIFRVFSFFDKGQIVVLINGFQKKSQKTPRSEIKFAENLKKEYFQQKKNNINEN